MLKNNTFSEFNRILLFSPYFCLGFLILKLYSLSISELIPVGAPFNAWVCGRSHVGIAGSNPAGSRNVCLLLVLCVVR